MKYVMSLLTCAIGLANAVAQENATPRGAVPIEPITAILEQFKTHDVVALGEGNHGNEPSHAFRIALIRDPRFAATVNDIVVEFGNSLYQPLADRFVGGEEIADKELRQIWQNTGQRHTVWDRPIYEQFFREVRAINTSLPKERRLRVLLGDPAFDWSNVNTPQDFGKQNYIRMDTFPVEVIKREVLSKGRRALVIFGDMHYLRKNLYYAFKDREMAEAAFNEPVDSIVALLEKNGTKVFSIWTHTFGDLTALQPDIATWRTPSLVLVRDTHWGTASFFSFYPSNGSFMGRRNAAGDNEVAGLDPNRAPTMQEQVDAVLYLGPPAKFMYSKLSAALCADPEYIEMRTKRMSLLPPPPPPPGRPARTAPDPAAQLKRECAAASAM